MKMCCIFDFWLGFILKDMGGSLQQQSPVQSHLEINGLDPDTAYFCLVFLVSSVVKICLPQHTHMLY